MKPEEIFFPNIPSDDGCAAVRERLLVPHLKSQRGEFQTNLTNRAF